MQTQLPNIPLTILCQYGGTSEIVIGIRGGTNFNAISNPIPNGTTQGYWAVVLDRSTLKVVENFFFQDPAIVPSQFTPYLNSTDYIYIINAISDAGNLPVGNFYKWLMDEGAGPGLKGLEQSFAALNCGRNYIFEYVMVDIFGPDSGNSFEFASTNGGTSTYINLEFQPFTIDGKTMYVPVSLT